MAAAVQTLAPCNAENRDEDFDFHRANSRVSSPKRVLKPNNMAENWDDDFVDQTRVSPRSTKKQQHVFHTSHSKGAPTENWDDYFEDNDQPTARPSRVSTAPSHAENWDEEFAANEPPAENWDDEFGHSSDEDQADKEDRTVTARVRHFQPPNATPPPPVPPLPDDLRTHGPHFSPTESIFSLPTTIGRPESSTGYSVTSVAALRPTGASTSARRFAGLPANAPTRERRRLRKKSRPPPMDGAVMELEDRSPTPPEVYERVSTPEPSDTYPPDFNPQTPQHANPPTTTNKTPLLSRIGSVKRWRPGRKRLSTDPKDVEDTRRENDIEVTPRPPNVLAKVQQTHSDGNGGGLPGISGSVGRNELKSGKSVEKLGLGPSPRHIRKRRPNREPSPSPFSTRPNSMMASSSSGSAGKPRHVSSTATFNSGNRSASASRTSFSASMEDLTYRMVRSVSRDRHKGKERERDNEMEGKRVFMGGIRRISFGSKSTDRPKLDNDKLAATPTPKDKGRENRHGRSNTISSMDTSRPPWTMGGLVASSPPQLPAIPVLPLPLQLIPRSPIDPLPPPRPSESTSKSTTLLPAVELQPAKSLPRPSLDLRPATSDTVPPLPLSRKSLEATNSLIAKATASPQQAASLGRSSQPPKRSDTSPTEGKVPRRNSLNDLRIPARITQAQTGLRRDLTLVKEFAMNVEQLKELQETYSSLVLEIHTILHAQSRPMTPAIPSRPTSPTIFFTPRRRSRSNATTMPPSAQIRAITTSAAELQSKFAITWECAELLIELGGGTTVPSRIPKVQSKSSLTSKVFPSTSSAPPEVVNSVGRRGRERAITLGGDEQKVPLPETEPKPNTVPATPRDSGDWSGTSGKSDLNSRQLLLLREMLNHSDADDTPQSVLERLRVLDSQVNRDWSWGGPMGSTITLPPRDDPSHNHRSDTPSDRSPIKKRRTSRLGMSAVRDMLRSLKRSVTEANQTQHQRSPHPPSSGSSIGLADRPAQRRRAKTSIGPPGSDMDRESPVPHSRRDPRSPYNTASSNVHKSPRRPSLASIFRFAHKSKSNANSGNSTDRSSVRNRSNPPSSNGTGSQATMEDEDWDRVEDSASDLDFHSPRSTRSTSGGTDASSTLRAKRANQGQPEKSPYLTFQDNLPPEPFTPRRGGPPGPEASRSSVWEGTWSRGTKLSNVEEIAEGSTPVKRGPTKRPSRVFGLSPSPSLRRHLSDAKRPQPQPQPIRMNGKRLSGIPPSQHGEKTGSIRSTPPQSAEQTEGLPDPKLAMTPENIKPLLDSAREVLARCTECIVEIRSLLTLLETVKG